ncbi:hypothetical protein ACH4CD_10285, partial [Streptomyces fungicidicus]|uniref:hypothetical protein n=1 Tax=Streptomyces fungicidicus TaxID=68203 RepID=UPI00378BF3C3
MDIEGGCMNPTARSPFGPAAEQHCNIKAHAELVLLDENVKTVSYMASWQLSWAWGVGGGDGLFRTDCGRSR